MTLGRTTAGAIKIKTGDAGLRAVSCGCCGGQTGPCVGCPTFEELTGATAINLTYNPCSVCTTLSENFNMVEPFTSIEYSLDGEDVRASSGACGAQIEQMAYGFTRVVYLSISRQNDECVAIISTGGGGGDGGLYSAQWGGSITVPISELFGTHTIQETGQACQVEFDEDGNNIGCTPINTSTTVTIA